MFQTIFYQPILNLLVVIYNNIPGHDIGVTIILLTLVIKMLLYPLSKKAIISQKALQELQPKVEALKRQFKGQKEQLSKAMLELYKNEKINPFSSCLPLLVQLPFFWAVYMVFRASLANKSLDLVYSFVYNPGALNTLAFGFLNFSKPNIILAILAGLAQYWQAKMLPTKKPAINAPESDSEAMAAIMNKQMLYFFPVLTILICLSLPSGLSFYWLISTLLTITQQAYIFNQHSKKQAVKNNIIEGQVL